MNIAVRLAKETDLAVLLEFEQGIVTAERPFDPSLKSGTIHYYDLLALIKSPVAAVFVAVVDSEIVGSGSVKILAGEPYQNFDNYAYLGFMYVKPALRGKGINKLVLEEIVNWSRSNGIKELRLDVYDENTVAKNAYLKAGFTASLLRMRMEI